MPVCQGSEQQASGRIVLIFPALSDIIILMLKLFCDYTVCLILNFILFLNLLLFLNVFSLFFLNKPDIDDALLYMFTLSLKG